MTTKPAKITALKQLIPIGLDGDVVKVPPVVLNPDEVVQKLGKRVAQLRRERGLSQQGLAALVRSTPQWISQVERGKRSVTVHTLVKLAGGLSVPLATLFDLPE